MFFHMVYKSGQIFLPFCHNSRVWQTDGQTDRILIAFYRVCIPCSAVKTLLWTYRVGQENRTVLTVVFSVYYRFSELMQRIFEYGDIENTSLPPPIKRWTFWYIERLPVRHHIHELYTLKWSVFWPTLYI